MRNQNSKTYRVVVSAATDQVSAESGNVLKLRYLVGASSPTEAKKLLPMSAYQMEGLRRARRLRCVKVTSVKKEEVGGVPQGGIVGVDDVSALSLRIMAEVRAVQKGNAA